jgi:hypothetical protein
MAARLSAIRYRPWQSLVLVLMSAVVAGTAILAPLYDRALQQAMVSDLISQAAPDVASVSVRSTSAIADQAADPPYRTEQMLTLFPTSARRYFGPAITTTAASVTVTDPRPVQPVGALLSRDGMCDHVEFAAGSCPSARDQIAISTDDAEIYDWTIGDAIQVGESSPLLDPPAAHHRSLEVVGIYSTDPDQAYWVSKAPVGKSGFANIDGIPQHDGWLTDASTLESGQQAQLGRSGRWSSWAALERTVDLALDRTQVEVDELFAIAEPVERYLSHPVDVPTWSTGAGAQAFSGIPDLAARAEKGREHAHVLVPLFVVQLALLAALALWLVLGAAVDQRRPEVAVVRLRGGDARACRRLLVGELGPPILVGWVVGSVTATAAMLVVGRRWLEPNLPLELSPLVWGTAAAVLVVEVLLLLAATWSTVTASASDLLRRVRPRTGWAVSLGPVLVVVMCGAAFAATATGSLSGWAAVAAPTLLAIAAGLVLAYLLGPVAGRSGSRLLARGHLVAGLSLLQLGRRHGMRTAIATIVAAAALLAFAVNALGVGERNRTELARATVGAPTVLNAVGTDLAAVRAALRDVDPSGESVTVAARASSSGGGMSTVAIVPDEFARIASFSDAAAARKVADALRSSAPEPLEVRGTHLTLDVEWGGGTADLGPSGEQPIELQVRVVRPESVTEEVPLEAGPTRGAAVRWRTDTLECSEGCLLTGFVVSSEAYRALRGNLTISSATIDGDPLAIGDQDDWNDTTPHDNGSARPLSATSGFAFRVEATRGFEVRLGHRSLPPRMAAVTSGALPPDSAGRDFTSVGIDGVLRPMQQVAVEPYLPGAPADTAMVDLDVLERDGVDLDLATRLQVYLDDSVSVATVTEALADHGVAVDSVTRIDDLQDDYQRSAPAWALQLGVVAAGAAALLAALVLGISFITSWRLRSADSLALRLSGVSNRQATVIALLEVVPLVVLSVGIGITCGVLGSRTALPDIPFFDTTPELPVGDLSTSWGIVLSAAAGLLAALTALAVATSLRLGRRALSQASEDT